MRLRKIITKVIFWALVFCVVTGLETGAETFFLPPEGYFDIEIQGQTTGTSHFQVEEVTEGYLVLSSKTEINIMTPQGMQNLEFITNETLSAGNLLPLSYELLHGPQRLTALYTNDKIELHFYQAGNLVAQKEVEIASRPFLLDNNMPHHYFYLLNGIELDTKESQTIYIHLPGIFTQLATPIPFTYTVEEKEMDYQGTPVLTYMVKGNTLGTAINIYIGKETRELLVIEFPGQLTKFIRTDTASGEVQFLDFYRYMADLAFQGGYIIRAEVDLGDFKDLDSLSVNFRGGVSVYGGELTLNNTQQNFIGEILDMGYNNYIIEGDIQVGRQVGPDAVGILLTAFNPVEVDKRYLMAEESIQVNHPLIRAKAAELTVLTEDVWVNAQRIGQWVYENISYVIRGYSALETLENMEGDCGPQTQLTIALLRAAGIPARMVGGIMYTGPYWGQHYWVEVYLGEDTGWVAIDPTAGEVATLSAARILLWRGLAALAPEVAPIEITVTTL